MIPCVRPYAFSYSGDQIETTSEFRLTTNKFTEILHKIGDLLTRPLLFEINQATKLHSGNWRPGKDYQALTLKEKAWKWAKMSSVFTLVFPLIALVLGGLGFLLTSLASFSKPDVFLLKNPKTNKDEKDSKVFRLMTYNMALGPKFMNNEGNMRSCSQRAREIGNWLSAMENAPDVICAQECFDLQATKFLCGYLKDYPFIVYGVAPNKWGVNSGLAIFSKLPITKIDYKLFSNLSGEDAWSNKGMLGVTVDRGNQKFTIVNTHLQAKIGEKYENIRLQQVQELKNFVESVSQGKTNFLAGDFNLSHISEFEELTTTLKTAQNILGNSFENLFYQDHSMQGEKDGKLSPGSWYSKSLWGKSDWKKETVTGYVVDHIFSYGKPINENAMKTFIEVSEISKESGQSDHLPLMVEVKYLSTYL